MEIDSSGFGMSADQAARLELRHRSLAGHVFTDVELAAAVVAELPQHLGFGDQLDQLEVDPLVLDERLAERLSAAQIVDRHPQDLFRTHVGADGADEAFLLELQHLVDEALPFFADAIRDRHAHVVECQFGRVARPVAHLLEFAADGEAR